MLSETEHNKIMKVPDKEFIKYRSVFFKELRENLSGKLHSIKNSI